MSNSQFSYDDASQSQVMGTWEEGLQFAPTPGYFMLDSLSPTPDHALQMCDHLEFLPLAEWMEGKDYEEQPPNYICYTIAWRIIINYRVEARETEQDLVVASSEYWKKHLKSKIEGLVHKKKHDWWQSEECLPNKMHRLMLKRRALDSLQSGGMCTISCDVSVPLCHYGQWCWQDPKQRKHYKLRTTHLTSLIKHVDNGGKLENHQDVPDNIREVLYMEAQRRFEKGSGKAHNITAGAPYPPININVLPGHSTHGSVAAISSPEFEHSNEQLKLSRPQDEAVKEYCKWQEQQVTDETHKADWRKACDITLSHGLDLELVYEDQEHVKFLLEQEVMKGTARHFIQDIHEWATIAKRILSHQGRVEENFDEMAD
ncbi:hypothetical protein CISG_03404 [Coccidioides immitis RMSCC 3703]|uniref:Uncharacterized protein n=1 Tax=Coccidioides immitis RMSCC 3703 TaxID=454286 RepID=A0A0J8QPC5_COCIT|nr:hypothetical protein CISG_03404 [Coccidioides immitis RMSCC 3703]